MLEAARRLEGEIGGVASDRWWVCLILVLYNCGTRLPPRWPCGGVDYDGDRRALRFRKGTQKQRKMQSLGVTAQTAAWIERLPRRSPEHLSVAIRPPEPGIYRRTRPTLPWKNPSPGWSGRRQGAPVSPRAYDHGDGTSDQGGGGRGTPKAPRRSMLGHSTSAVTDNHYVAKGQSEAVAAQRTASPAETRRGGDAGASLEKF